MRIWNTIFTGLIHEKSKVESDLERSMNSDTDATAKMVEVSALLDKLVLVDSKIIKWQEIKPEIKPEVVPEITLNEKLKQDIDDNITSDTE